MTEQRGVSSAYTLRTVLTLLTVGSVVLLAGCSVLEAEADERITVEMPQERRFIPTVLEIEPGTTVVWSNVSETVHAVTTDPEANEIASAPEGAEPLDSGNLFAGDQWSYEFTEPGTWTYACAYHGDEGMTGVITVSE